MYNIMCIDALDHYVALNKGFFKGFIWFKLASVINNVGICLLMGPIVIWGRGGSAMPPPPPDLIARIQSYTCTYV